MHSYNSVERVWYGPKVTSVFHPDASAGKVLEFVMKQHYPRIGLVFEPTGEQWTYEKILKTACIIAQNILKKGLTQDDVIGICASNTLFVTPLALAALMIGVPMSTLDPSFDKDGIKHMYKITKPKIMFCDGKILQKVTESFEELGNQVEIFVVDVNNGKGTIDEFLEGTGEMFTSLPLKYGGDHSAIYLPSSGSTGLPKAVRISHKSLITSTFIEPTSTDTVFCFSTLYWISGLVTFFQPALNGAKRIITNQPFNPEYMLRVIEKYKVTIMATPPSQLVLIGQSPILPTTDLSSLTLYILAGGAIPFHILQKVKQFMPNAIISGGYGCSELAACCTTGEVKAPNANGHVRENHEITIIDDDGNNLGVGDTGEIVVKRPTNWLGYHGNEEATKGIWINGCIYTGDLGYFDENETLFVVDRKKEILKYKNFHYSPNEIEQVILELPEVVEVSVVGIPDLIMTDLPAAAVVKKENSFLSEKDIYDHVARKMVDFKHLRGGVYFVDAVPKTASGKNLRRIVKEMLTKLYNAKNV
ncbi:hypothetical protein ACFFRR_001858 [Megaselia abdita]